MALDVVSDYITEARVLLQDQVSPYRYADSDLVTALNLAMLEARRLRPDLFLAATSAVPTFTANNATAVPMDPMYRVAFVYYIVGNAHLRDEESPEDTRATAFMAAFNKQLTSAGG